MVESTCGGGARIGLCGRARIGNHWISCVLCAAERMENDIGTEERESFVEWCQDVGMRVRWGENPGDFDP